MLPDELIKKGISVLQNELDIGPEYHSTEFTFGSIDKMICKLFDTNGVNINRTKYIESAFGEIEDLKTIFLENNENKKLYAPRYDTSKAFSYLKKFDTHSIAKSILILTEEWEDIALKNKVDITEDLETISEIVKKLRNHDLINKMTKELEFISSILKKMMNINKVANSIEGDVKNSSKEYIDLSENLKNFFNNDSNIFSKDKKMDYAILLKELDIENLLNESKKCIKSIHKKIIKESIATQFSYAETYLKCEKGILGDASLIKIIQQKIMEDPNTINYELNPFQKFKSIIWFNEDSSLIVNDNGTLKVVNDNTTAKKIMENLFKDEISFELRKKPTVAKQILKMYSGNFSYFRSAMIAVNTYNQNENILKAQNFDISDYKDKSFEILDDAMSEHIREHKIKQYAHSIASNKYIKTLYNEDTYSILKEIYDLNVEASVLQDFVGKKIAAYKTPQELNNALTKMLNNFSDFNMDKIIEKSKNSKAEIMYNEDDVLVLKINNFSQSNELGSNSWCISRNDYYFDSYTKNQNTQYFIYDFNKSSKDDESMIGLTLSANGEYHTAHKKNDDKIGMIPLLYKIQLSMISNNLDRFPRLSNELREEIQKNNKSKLKGQSI